MELGAASLAFCLCSSAEMNALSRKPGLSVTCQAKSVHKAPPKNKPKVSQSPIDCSKLFTDAQAKESRFTGPIEVVLLPGKAMHAV